MMNVDELTGIQRAVVINASVTLSPAKNLTNPEVQLLHHGRRQHLVRSMEEGTPGRVSLGNQGVLGKRPASIGKKGCASVELQNRRN